MISDWILIVAAVGTVLALIVATVIGTCPGIIRQRSEVEGDR